MRSGLQNRDPLGLSGRIFFYTPYGVPKNIFMGRMVRGTVFLICPSQNACARGTPVDSPNSGFKRFLVKKSGFKGKHLICPPQAENFED